MSGELSSIDWGMSTDDQYLPKNLDELITGFIACRVPGNEDEDGQYWTWEATRVLTDRYPDLALAFIKGAVTRPMPEVVRGVLAAGPLEDLLAKHGPSIIEDIERLAPADPLFRETLGGVWQSDMTPEVWARVQAAQVD